MSNSAKRTRLSGAEYKKKKISRELDESKQKDSLLNFFPKVTTSPTYQDNENNVNSENSEIESVNIDVCDNVQANKEIVKDTFVSTLKASVSQNKKDNSSVSVVNIKENNGLCENLSVNVSKETKGLTPIVKEYLTLSDDSNCETLKQNYLDFSTVKETSTNLFDLQLLKDPAC